MTLRTARKIFKELKERRHNLGQVINARRRLEKHNLNEGFEDSLTNIFGIRKGINLLYMHPRKLVNGKPVKKSSKTKRMRHS